jgi:hypothetical protein
VELLDAFLSWAWARHHNVLSWYVRPLFLLPFCYFAYRRSVKGIALTLLALATSMFWSPSQNSQTRRYSSSCPQRRSTSLEIGPSRRCS